MSDFFAFATTFLRSGRAAMTFLTRIPVGGFPYTDEEWRWSSAWFPAIGLALGALYAQIFMRTAAAGGMAAATLTVIAALLVTGAFHEDGLADTADALGGAYTRDRVLEILKDSRVGAFGAAALVVAILLRVALIARLGASSGGIALIIAESISRAAPVWMMALVPYATSDEQSKSRLITRAGFAQAMVGSGWSLAALAIAVVTGRISVVQAVVVIILVGLMTVYLIDKFVTRVQGVTGDFLGATQQVLVCLVLLLFALL
jgi:adenosylcobinamide-GDP ribazoletransferase